MNTVLFDLDGTLLPMDQNEFLQHYFRELATVCSGMGYDPEQMTKAVWEGMKAMIANDGNASNEDRFWEAFANVLGQQVMEEKPQFIAFYDTEFNRISAVARPDPAANDCVRMLKEKGYQVVLATNPMFPRNGTLARMRWAGLDPNDFALITTYEDFTYCKPNLNYYRSVLQRIGRRPEDCMMVGNDVREDMCAAELGMDTYLLTVHLVNPDQVDINQFKHGSLEDLLSYVERLPAVTAN